MIANTPDAIPVSRALFTLEEAGSVGLVPIEEIRAGRLRAELNHVSRGFATYENGWWSAPDNEVLSGRGWKLLPQLLHRTTLEDTRLVRVLSASGMKGFAGTVTGPGEPEPSLVWRIPLTVEAMRSFLSGHVGMDTMMLEEQSRCAIFADGEQFMTLAGPEKLLRDVAGDVATRLREVRTHAAEMDRFNRNSDYAAFFANLADHLITP